MGGGGGGSGGDGGSHGVRRGCACSNHSGVLGAVVTFLLIYIIIITDFSGSRSAFLSSNWY